MSKSVRVVIIKGNEWHSEAHRARAVLVIVLERERELVKYPNYLILDDEKPFAEFDDPLIHLDAPVTSRNREF